MSQFIRRGTTAIELPGSIALLLPTKKRVDFLNRLLDSIQDSASVPSRIQVRCLIDHDDNETTDYISKLKPNHFSFKLQTLFAPPSASQGERYNLLRMNLRPYPEIYMPMADDVIIASKGWDEMILDSFAESKSKLKLCYPADETVLPDQASYTIIHATWVNLTQRFATEWFPFWFEDVWLDQVGDMIGEKTKLPFQILAPEGKGKTFGMRNLPFWGNFFKNLFDERQEEAKRLVRTCPYLSAEESENRLVIVERRAQELLARIPLRSDAELTLEEQDLSGEQPHTRAGEKYYSAETRAVWWLNKKLVNALEEGNENVVASVLHNIKLASPENCYRGLDFLDRAWRH